MEATFSSETSADFQRTVRRYIPEDRTLHNHRCENLRPYNYVIAFPVAKVVIQDMGHFTLTVKIARFASLNQQADDVWRNLHLENYETLHQFCSSAGRNEGRLKHIYF
jgi:hypothetical protein